MAYANFSSRVMVLAIAPWYRIEHLMSTLVALRKINFSIVEQRQQALERLNNLMPMETFNLTTRFKDGTYVCELLGDWSRKFQQLRSALSFKEREVGNRTENADKHFQAASDSHVAYHSVITNMLDELVRVDAIWSTNTFETYFNVVWNAPPPPPIAVVRL